MLTHFSPGISNKLVSPVQLMSSFWEGMRQKRRAILSKKALIAEKSIPPRLNRKAKAVTETDTRMASGDEQTHRPLDEKHGDRSNNGHVSDQRLQDHPHHAVKL